MFEQCPNEHFGKKSNCYNAAMENQDKKSTHPIASSILLAAVLVGIGIASRLLLADWPNFNPTIAIAIFIGYAIGNRWIGASAIVLMMGISDAVIGFYDLRIMLSVYGGFIVAWMLGFAFRRLIDSPGFAAKFSGIVAPAIISSLTFFLITNSACWLVGWYPMTWDGLVSSLVAGLPFLRSALTGNVFFCTLIFSVHFAIQFSRKEQTSGSPGRSRIANDSRSV